MAAVQTRILELERRGLVTRTFRRLDPARQMVVVDAIVGEAAEAGVAGVGVKLVAARAGVSVGSLYQYFGDRGTMVRFAVEVSDSLLVDSFRHYAPVLAELPLRDALQAYLVGGIEWSEGYTALLRLFARAAYQGEDALAESIVTPVATAMQDVIRAILKAAAARGELREGIDMEATVRMVNLLTVAVADSWLLPHLDRYYRLYGQALVDAGNIGEPPVPADGSSVTSPGATVLADLPATNDGRPVGPDPAFAGRIAEMLDFVIAAVGAGSPGGDRAGASGEGEDPAEASGEGEDRSEPSGNG